MVDLRMINSDFNVFMTFKYWTNNIMPLRESLSRKSFALASAGLVQQGTIVAQIEAGPLAYKETSTLSHDPSNRRLILSISNSKAPNENLTEILSTLDLAGIATKDLIERVDMTGTVLIGSSIEPVKIIQKTIPRAIMEKIKLEIGREAVPIGITIGTTNRTTDIFEKPHFSMRIEPLFTDIESKFLASIAYNGNSTDDAVSFLSDLFSNIQKVIRALGGE